MSDSEKEHFKTKKEITMYNPPIPLQSSGYASNANKHTRNIFGKHKYFVKYVFRKAHTKLRIFGDVFKSSLYIILI